MREYYILSRIAKTTPNADKDLGQQELLFIAGETEKWSSFFGRQFESFFFF
jgi:hypothetical protein